VEAETAEGLLTQAGLLVQLTPAVVAVALNMKDQYPVLGPVGLALLSYVTLLLIISRLAQV